MPSVRSLIQMAVAVAVLSLVVAWVNLLQPPGSQRTGRDTYGTRESGYRAIFETLEEIGVDVERRLHPPVPNPDGHSVVFLNPNPWICGTEPAYLKNLRSWIEAGGRVVVASGAAIPQSLDRLAASQSPTELPTILESLGLEGVSFELADWNEWTAWQEFDSAAPLAESLLKGWNRELVSPQVVDVKCTGTLSEWREAVQELALPGTQAQSLIWEDAQPVGQIVYSTEEEQERVVAAVFSRGKGEIIVADEGLFRNRLLPLNDNSVAAAYLISPHGKPVVFDEFYHGLGVRGNPLYLLTQPGYAALALGLLLLIGLNSWRKAIPLGPPLPDEPQNRRDIGEYITAMGQFLSQGKASDRLLISKLRDGVLRELNLDYAVPPEIQNVDLVVGLMARKDPARAKQVQQAFDEADAFLDSRIRVPKTHILPMMQRLTACL
jgi:hypothetical protein